MTENTKITDDLDKFFKERSAATAMRDDLHFLVGWTTADNPEISERLRKILKQHEENREQNWL